MAVVAVLNKHAAKDEKLAHLLRCLSFFRRGSRFRGLCGTYTR
jgi:hypothetical protein